MMPGRGYLRSAGSIRIPRMLAQVCNMPVGAGANNVVDLVRIVCG